MRTNLLKHLLILLLLYGTANAQQNYPFQRIEEYRKHNSEYNQWLVNTGLSDYLERDTMVIDNNQKGLYLQLQIKGQSQADKLNRFKSLQRHYNQELNIPFNDLMFKNMIHIYKVLPQKANLQIVAGNYYYFIYVDSATNKITVNESSIRAAIEYTEDIHLNKNDTVNLQLSNSQYKNKIIIYKTLLRKFKDYFSIKVNDIDKYFIASSVSANRPLTFTIDNLRKEVLTDAGNPLFCSILNWFFDDDDQIDCTPREYLKFEITAIVFDTPDGKAISIKCSVTGKYCAFFGNYNTENYNDMETDYSSYLKAKTKQYTNKITEFLTN